MGPRQNITVSRTPPRFTITVRRTGRLNYTTLSLTDAKSAGNLRGFDDQEKLEHVVSGCSV